jgi:hypothetical protein
MRHAIDQEYDDEVPFWTNVSALFRRRPKFHVVPKPETRPRTASPSGVFQSVPDDDVDALLDKIARNGIASLTAGERQQLERAREALLKKDRD